MKKKKKCLCFLAASLSVAAVFAFSACSASAGKDGKDFNLYSVYLELVEEGQFTGTYSDFVKQYLNVNVSEDTSSLSTAINSTLTSVVSIRTKCDYQAMMGMSTYEASAAGSGVIYSISDDGDDAYIVTNYHVVYDDFSSSITPSGSRYTYTRVTDELEYKVYLYGMEYSGSASLESYPDYGITATVVGYSMANDIAVLKIENSEILKKSMATSVTLGDSDRAYIGDEVFVVGNPLGEGLAATSGIVSSESENVQMTAVDNKTVISPRAVRVSAIINEGNSGGGLFNKKGELLGIVFAKNVENYVEGVGYALPVSAVSGLADKIIATCDGDAKVTVKKATLGVTTYVGASEQYFVTEDNRMTQKQSIVVRSTELGSLAAGGLKSGDVLKSAKLGDRTLEITREWQLADLLWRANEGDALTLTVERNGEETTVSFTIRAKDFTSVK